MGHLLVSSPACRWSVRRRLAARFLPSAPLDRSHRAPLQHRNVSVCACVRGVFAGFVFAHVPRTSGRAVRKVARCACHAFSSHLLEVISYAGIDLAPSRVAAPAFLTSAAHFAIGHQLLRLHPLAHLSRSPHLSADLTPHLCSHQVSIGCDCYLKCRPPFQHHIDANS